MEPKKILFVTQEINPYVPESDLTKLGRNVPLSTIDKGREIRAFMPKWGNINERRNQLHEVIRLSGMNIVVSDVDHPLIIKVASIAGTRMQVYFIDNEDFFAKRLEECDENGNEYADNLERSVFYARGVLETVKKLRWAPDVIHCQGWVACAIPFLLKTVFADEPCFRTTHTVYTATPNKLTLNTSTGLDEILGETEECKNIIAEFGDSLTPKQIDMLGIKYADGVTFNTATPDAELLAYAQGKGLPVLIDENSEAEKYTEFFDSIWTANDNEA